MPYCLACTSAWAIPPDYARSARRESARHAYVSPRAADDILPIYRYEMTLSALPRLLPGFHAGVAARNTTNAMPRT